MNAIESWKCPVDAWNARGYVLVPTVLGGAHEWMAHLTQLVLVWIAILAMTSLVLRFGWNRWHAIAGALLLVAIPPFLPMASTAMPDILATAVALVAMERLAAWKAERKWEPGRGGRYRAGPRRLCSSTPRASSASRGILSAGKHQSQGDSGTDPPEIWLWTPVFAGSVLLLAIIVAHP